MGLGERKGSASTSMGKEKMNFDFFFFKFKMFLLKPGLSNLIEKYTWLTEQTLFNTWKATSDKVSIQKPIYEWGAFTYPSYLFQ